MFLPFVQGAAVGGGLIVAIGAQNAFVLAQGVRRNRPLLIALICACCDALLILLGVSGVGGAVAANPLLGRLAAWGGVLFLGWYGALALRSACRGGTLEADGAEAPSLRSLVAATLAVTLLNPHVYLDTVVLLGGLSGRFPEEERFIFGAGAMAASLLWFLALSLGAGLLAPLFRRKFAWRILDAFVCLSMWSIALSLLWAELA